MQAQPQPDENQIRSLGKGIGDQEADYGVRIGDRQGKGEENEVTERRSKRREMQRQKETERKECVGACKASDENEVGSR